MASASLEGTAVALVAPGRGILAADESHATIGRRFDALGIANSEENRRRYRQLLFTTKGIGDFISGVILFDETIRQTADDGRPFTEVLASAGVIAGIKVDRGSKPLAGAPGEQVTEGLDELRERLAEYKTLGARFAKWRAVITLGEDGRTPTRRGLEANAHALARYAALCQEAGIVPIVEPEVLMDGEHTIERSFHVTARVLFAVFTELADQKVQLEGTLLKPNMVLSGYDASDRVGVDAVAKHLCRPLVRVRVDGEAPERDLALAVWSADGAERALDSGDVPGHGALREQGWPGRGADSRTADLAACALFDVPRIERLL